MSWIQQHYELIGSVLAAITVLIGWLQYSKKEPSTVSSKDSRVDHSAIITGSHNQVVISDTPSLQNRLEAQVASVAEPPKPRANFQFCGVSRLDIVESMSGTGVFFQRSGALPALVARFSNDAVAGAENKVVYVKATLIYKNVPGEELLRTTGSWLEQVSGELRFDIDESHKLIILFRVRDDLFVLEKQKQYAHWREFWSTHVREEMRQVRDTLRVMIRVTELSSGYCLFESEFEIAPQTMEWREVKEAATTAGIEWTVAEEKERRQLEDETSVLELRGGKTQEQQDELHHKRSRLGVLNERYNAWKDRQ